MDFSKKDYHIINSFHLKIIGMISMIIDHIGVLYEIFHNQIYSYDINIQIAFRIIGRLSFIIFAFVTVESVLHSRKPLIYLLKLLILSVFCDLAFFIFSKTYIGNPITTLFIGGLIVYLLNDKKIYIKFLSLIPLLITFLIAFEIIPLKSDYDIYGVITILIFYASKLIADASTKLVANYYSLDKETFLNSSYYLTLRNAISIILFISYSLIIYFTNPIWNGKGLFSEVMSIQIYALFALIPIFFYNGKRGYNKKWFQYGCYIFYPLHILIIYIIFSILIYYI